jgi:hypothetical protein
MSRAKNRRVVGWMLAGAALWALTASVRAEQHGQAIEISAPAGTKTVSTSTNLDSGKSQELRDEMIRKQLSHEVFRPFNAAQEPSLNGMVFMPSSRPELTPQQAKKLKEMVDQERYWMYATPEDATADSKPSDDTLNNDSPLGGDYDSDAPKALKGYFNHSAHGRFGSGNTNSLTGREHDRYGTSKRDALPGDIMEDDYKSAGGQHIINAFESPANRTVDRMFQSPGARDAISTAGSIGGAGLFSDSASPVADNFDRDRQIDRQNNINFQGILNSSSPKPAGGFDAISPAAPAGGSPFASLNDSLGGGPISPGLSSPSLQGISSSVGTSSFPASAAPAASGMMPYQPSGPRPRSF